MNLIKQALCAVLLLLPVLAFSEPVNQDNADNSAISSDITVDSVDMNLDDGAASEVRGHHGGHRGHHGHHGHRGHRGGRGWYGYGYGYGYPYGYGYGYNYCPYWNPYCNYYYPYYF